MTNAFVSLKSKKNLLLICFYSMEIQVIKCGKICKSSKISGASISLESFGSVSVKKTVATFSN